MVYAITSFVILMYLRIFFGFKIIGKEKVPDGPLILCGNHTRLTDCVLITIALGTECRCKYMAKEELFKHRLGAWFFGWLGGYPVSRGVNDLSAIKKTIEMLRQGYKLIIFPDGTRMTVEDPANAKNGVALISVRSKTMVQPLYIQRVKRPIGHSIHLTFGDAYLPEMVKGISTSDAYKGISMNIMERVYALKHD
jgi:1-acyl-sn-glycerol-3-phosphate acyltransferase